MRKQNQHWQNPFNGSRTHVTWVISEKHYEEKIDHNDYDLEDYNEYYKLYVHKESKEGLLVKLPTLKHNPYIK